ncbi:SusD/RagB family nutrient-binding outer membrane lipoprotein [Dyadobacter sandarakinus]|uniref:SusD/RagB family nutrient-binding outer membrane lipoprotein n=1 Tax=Dyadobacter sandarakinus TaxID=2747268 RepID=A0ABX7IBJ7_9BACT|nr:SusD/RagB family nutrient-binding outer membrane lipoprotein [Dyadobacter sandarakinus]QRR02508.1 SusD/RagB family nutrient-binding outer membrane lipoprotein [Dyadobacter sandarakinus]
MKFLKHKLILLAAAGFLSSCEKEAFVDINKNPDALTAVPPQNQFLNATISTHSADFEFYYDMYRRIMPWMQYNTDQNGNQGAFTQNWDNFSQRYGRLYNGVGDRLYDLEQLVTKLEANDQPRYVHMIQMAHILKANYTFYVSDIYGSIPYTEAFQGRYGGTLQPKYDTQQEIFTKLDAELKTAITTLKTAQPIAQFDIGAYDQYFRGDAQKWVKAANALRLKIAIRMQKADAAAGNAIITEVLGSPATDLMSSNADSWVFVSNAAFTGTGDGGNWNPGTLRAAKPMVDFMWNTKDPRIDAFFAPNQYSQANIDILIKDKVLPAGTKEGRRYVGSFPSPDDAKITANIQKYYTPKIIPSTKTTVDTLSYLQPRLFSAGRNDASGNAGTGFSYLPVITYAEVCFLRAELALKGIGTGTAKDWYEAGIKSSIQWYDEIGKGSKLNDYSPVTEDEVTAYLKQPGVAFETAKAMDQIASQAYLHFMKQPQEGWDLWKRTGYPNANSIVPLVPVKNLGVTLVIPRRAPLPLITETDPNAANKQSAYAAMQQLPGFGTSPQDATGRVWWDKP